VRNARDAGRHVRPRGEDLTTGDVAVAAGTRIGAAQLGVLASVGASHVEVHRRPRVAILSSGDELVDVDRFDEVIAGRRIVASNSYTLWGLVQGAEADAIDLGIVGDDPVALSRRIEEGIASCDMLLTSGGVSVGAYDFTRDVLSALGAELRLWRVRMRPGAPIGFGLLGPSPWIGLPGNPVSAMVTFELFARPALRRLAGHRLLFKRPTPVRVGETITLAAPLMHFLRAIVTDVQDGAPPIARLTGPQGSGLLTSMERANALVVVPEDRPRVEAGDVLRAIMLTDEARMATEIGL
jgi:molybdopterin molybdotransferase